MSVCRPLMAGFAKLLLHLHLEIIIDMSKRLFRYILTSVGLLALLPGCNSDDTDSAYAIAEEINNTSTAVSSFSLSRNNKVLANLDSVFFSIDLQQAEIFNADSLPVGTNVSRIVVKIGLPSVSVATLTETAAPGQTPRTIDYLQSSTDSIDFSQGPVHLHVVSNNGLSARDYTIKINVHRCEPDSLTWSREAMTELPGGIARPQAQKTVLFGSEALTIVQGPSGEATVSRSSNPGTAAWTTDQAILPQGARIETLTAVASTLYMLDSDGTLHTSADGISWSSTGSTFHWLYGSYDGSLLASRQSADGWESVTYPSMTAVSLPEDMPVSATSALHSYTTKWASTPTAVMVGGLKADGTCSPDVWAFDGTVWAKINREPFAIALRDATLVPYYSYVNGANNWTANEYPTLMVIGGRDNWGTAQRDVYVSVDNGVRWRRATDTLTLPDYLPDMYGADGLVFTETLHASRSASAPAWIEMPGRRLSPWLTQGAPALSRAVAPISEWDCPYIYLFGGYSSIGQLHNTVWRGVINRLQFIPLQ